MSNNFEEMNELMNKTVFSVSSMSEQLGLVIASAKRHDAEIHELKDRQTELSEAFSDYKKSQADREYISPAEVQELREAITNRVNDIFATVDIPMKYFKNFMRKAWIDAKRHGYVIGAAGVYTQKCHFNDAIDYIGTWIPAGYGIPGYVEHLDALAELRNK